MPDSVVEKKEEKWIKEYWRPAMAWQYLVVCLFDFLVAPILTGLYSFYAKITYVPWEPITLKESALYHLAMGAVIGVSAWSRGQEKIRRLEMYSGSEKEPDQFDQSPQQ